MTQSILSGIIIGDSAPIRRLCALIVRIAPARGSVLIHGPTGSGKEHVAEALHLLSGRPGRFVPFNVCAIADTMFQDALFGHERGGFTGAVTDRRGLLAEANHGTILFDEIAELNPASQVGLLRAIETRTFRRVGGTRDERSEFRVLAATNQSLWEAVRAGRFRADLLERLSTFTIPVPPLRDRPEDIPVLIAHFQRQLTATPGDEVVFTPRAMLALQDHDWPRNVRELRNTIERAMTLMPGAVVDRDDVAGLLGLRDVVALPARAQEVLDVLERVQWNTLLAAEALDVHRSTVYDWIQRWQLHPRRTERRRAGCRTPEGGSGTFGRIPPWFGRSAAKRRSSRRTKYK